MNTGVLNLLSSLKKGAGLVIYGVIINEPTTKENISLVKKFN